MKRTPNVLWIMTDQHRADCLGCMGHPVIQTPNLDRVARDGVVFENAFCQSPVTAPQQSDGSEDLPIRQRKQP